jgi:hypothetical protein
VKLFIALLSMLAAVSAKAEIYLSNLPTAKVNSTAESVLNDTLVEFGGSLKDSDIKNASNQVLKECLLLMASEKRIFSQRMLEMSGIEVEIINAKCEPNIKVKDSKTVISSQVSIEFLTK